MLAWVLMAISWLNWTAPLTLTVALPPVKLRALIGRVAVRLPDRGGCEGRQSQAGRDHDREEPSEAHGTRLGWGPKPNRRPEILVGGVVWGR